jgi:probable rRNA maturation factor
MTVTDPEAFVRHVAIAALRELPEGPPIHEAEVSSPGLKPAFGSAAGLRATPVEVSIRLTDDAEVRELNRVYRGQDKPTNVLSFAGDGTEPGEALDVEGAERQPVLLGDVVVAFETTAAEAAAMGRPIEAHLAHLIVHGVLHLLGYDHLEDGEAARMEALETLVLDGLGYPDPSSEDGAAAGATANVASNAAPDERLSEAVP